MSAPVPTPEETLEDALDIALRDLRADGTPHRVAVGLILGALCEATAAYLSHAANGDRRTLELFALSVCERIDRQAHVEAGFAPPERVNIGRPR